MQDIINDNLNRLVEQWDAIIREIPDAKAQLLETVGKSMPSVVSRNVGGTGKVGGWQTYYVGSGLGYVAVRPRSNTYQTTKGGKRYSVGYLTNAVNSGHSIRLPAAVKRDGYRYRPRIKTARVDGLHFYPKSEAEAMRKGNEALEQLARELLAKLDAQP